MATLYRRYAPLSIEIRCGGAIGNRFHILAVQAYRNNERKEITMKKLLSVLLVAIALFILTASAEGMVTGGWTPSEDPAITEDFRAVFDKAMEGLLGVNYTPVAYLGSQLVAGTNHCVLAQAQVVAPDARPYYALVYIYEDLEGNAKIMNIAELDISQWAQYGE